MLLHTQIDNEPQRVVIDYTQTHAFLHLNFSSEFLFQTIDIRSDGSFQNKLNVNAPEFKLKYDEPITFPQFIQHSKSSGNIQQQIQLAAARRHATQMLNATSNQPIMFSHPFDVLNAKADERTPLSDRVQTNVRN